MTKDVQGVRREKLQALIEKNGGPTSLAKRLGHSGPSYLSQLVSGTRPISEKTARKIEEQMGLAPGALDVPPGVREPFVGTDYALMAACVRAIGDALEAARLKPSSGKFAELVAVLYEHSVPAGRVDLDYVRRLLRLLV